MSLKLFFDHKQLTKVFLRIKGSILNGNSKTNHCVVYVVTFFARFVDFDR